MQETIISSIILAVVALVIAFTFIIIIVKRVVYEREKTQNEIYSTILKAQESEREKIASEIHDTLGAYITSSNLIVEGLRAKNVETPGIENLVNQLENNLFNIGQISRKASNLLAPPTLLRYGLEGVLNEYQNQFKSIVEFKILYQVQEPLGHLFQINLYRIINEIVNNAIKHAKAKTIFINLTLVEKKLHLHIGDDGIGFDYQQAKKKSTSGLINIENRCNLLNANLSVKTSLNNGCHYSIIVLINE
jgi:signal transduction histidine kinase